MAHRSNDPLDFGRRFLRGIPTSGSRLVVEGARTLQRTSIAGVRVVRRAAGERLEDLRDAALEAAEEIGARVAEKARDFRDAAIERIDSTRRVWMPVLLLVLLPLGILWVESKTSLLESEIFSSVAERLRYQVAKSPSSQIAFPDADDSGPFDTQRGYNLIPRFARSLEQRGFRILEQSRFSSGLMFLSRMGVPLPGRYRPVAGLVIHDAQSDTLYDAMRGHHAFAHYEDIPPVVTRSLLYLENRQLQDGGFPTRNPALDWPRLVKATYTWVGHKLGLPIRLEGGSTLAVQLQKYRHSTSGRTHSPAEKLRQITAASLNAYRTGPNTTKQGHEVVLDYLNTLPLAATPDYGEVSGLMDGLRVWFGLDPAKVWKGLQSPDPEVRAASYTPVLALLCAAQAPTQFLRHDHDALERRVHAYGRLFAVAGVIDPELAHQVGATPLEFVTRPVRPSAPVAAGQKSANAIRRNLSAMLGVTNPYDLNRLDLQVQTTLDNSLQSRTLQLFRELADTAFVNAHGLRGEHLLRTGNPARIAYSLLLFDADSDGDRACAHVDNLSSPFDLNTDMKLELGSTAKLRTLTHYLQIVEGLHAELAGLSMEELEARAHAAGDPITAWTAQTLVDEPDMSLDTLLDRSLDRKYSASPYETFFTGGGQHHFHNFEKEDDVRTLTIRDAFAHSTNLVFVRLLRDVVRYHEARLPYDVDSVLSNPDDPVRQRMLASASEQESRLILWRAFRRDPLATPEERLNRALGTSPSPKRAAALFYAWNRDTSVAALSAWLTPRFSGLSPEAVREIARVYGNPQFTLLDYAYATGMHPLELWCLGERLRDPSASWDSLWARSAGARELCERWLFEPKHFSAQNLRIRPQIESEAFDSITVAWRRVGFPFRRLVPSLATTLGASGDRPAALADLVGIIVNDGVERSPVNIERLVFAEDTPYHTALEAEPGAEQRLLSVPVAHTLRGVMAGVVERGTARRLDRVFTAADSTALPIGGKTGSGDNRFQTFARGGQLISSRPTSRTATFVFYVGQRHYGVITAAVMGPVAGDYEFTSALPLAILKLLSPAIEDHLHASGDDRATTTDSAERARVATTVGGAGGD
jgi:membrane peptidoglycan carboxypeptidase